MERVIDEHALYACHDLLLEHKAALLDHLVGRWRDLFNVSFDVLLYNLTSTYFEIDPPLDEHSKRQCCKAHRTWLMDRGIPTEEVLQQMRLRDPPVQYLVGTPKGRLTALERALLQKPWMKAREEVRVKLLAQDQGLYVFAESRDRIAEERGMRRRQLKWRWQRLQQLSTMPKLTRDQSHGVRSGQLWKYYLRLVAVEEAFKTLKGDLAIQPIFHQRERRIEAHIFIAFRAYCLHVTLGHRSKNL